MNKCVLQEIAGILIIGLRTMPSVHAEPYDLTSPTIAVPSQGMECTFAATLNDENGTPLPNIDIDYYVSNTSKLGTTQTNSSGVAQFQYTFAQPGTYRANARFSGTANYAPSRSDFAYIVVVDYTPHSYLIVGGVLAAAVTIGMAGYTIYRRKQGSEPKP